MIPSGEEATEVSCTAQSALKQSHEALLVDEAPLEAEDGDVILSVEAAEVSSATQSALNAYPL